MNSRQSSKVLIFVVAVATTLVAPVEAVAEEICTLITIIHRGRIIASDTPANIKNTIARTGGNLEKAFLKLTGHDEMASLRGSLGVKITPGDLH